MRVGSLWCIMGGAPLSATLDETSQSRVKNKASIRTVLVLLGVVGVVVTAQGWKRMYYSPVEVVGRAEIIAVGKVKPGSIVEIPHPSADSWEFHCELLISEVLKGTNSTPSMMININYGLTPITGGYISNEHGLYDFRRGLTNYPRDIVEIFDTGNSFETAVPITGDIRTNHIWLLRSQKVGSSSGIIGVYEPQDIQPIGMRSEILRCMSYLK